ncbi:hypothetical protein CPC735_073650 [Coccidioides posadasii C735 delta SOWgp]|uniref:Uncharacterized protein n=1 Tax=Coccidioides posadasii (strain C735) TaxID=222929 RepID=C5P038_COCP7|nr:hypothetical protein CPC735_073650 [Coccidioides posadasii C735 delta SOWgp]EER29683.1 hypothetical protein CPC735_073650 [Coccidioides posadasii C735 delta SOWgp]|eukprot:XP_003071828.1 hypothetical protein CPC735_073650 [Coccidioides posadasii C735 delta SOWgp]
MNEASLSGWRTNAPFWDTSMGSSGNDYFTVLEVPALERMIRVPPGEERFGNELRVLDLATGNGLVAHWLARKGASVVATDGCDEMVRLAEKRGEGTANVKYQVLDVTDSKQWEAFIREEVERGGAFDIITMNMAFMDVPDLEPLAAALPRILKRNGGIFVATLLHPFFTAGAIRSVEYAEDTETGQEVATQYIKLSKYLHVPPYKGVAMQDQPVSQPYFHRPFHQLFSTFFRAGMVLDALEEPNFDAEYLKGKNLETASLRQWTQIPKILAFRMRFG